MIDQYWHKLESNLWEQNVVPPSKFTFPFNYKPHFYAIQASKLIQEVIKRQLEPLHDFGFGTSETPSPKPTGKMFGVLICRNQNDELGFLAAYSGKLGNSNTHEGFVPPVFDMLNPKDFYKKGEEELNRINRSIEKAQNNNTYKDLNHRQKYYHTKSINEITSLKEFNKKEKVRRSELRESLLSKGKLSKEYAVKLKNESIHQAYELKKLKKNWKSKLQKIDNELITIENSISKLKRERKDLSNQLQSKLFQQYTFLNSKKETKSLLEIFHFKKGSIPSGAGECAVPKLLQYAFLKDLTPICFAEFWYGISPKTRIRKHLEYYPSCRSKCEPILGHMLSRTEMNKNPVLTGNTKELLIDNIFEDDHILIINKPSGLLSVPGKTETDSVQTRLADIIKVNHPIIIHRLDQHTSGIMIIAKSKHAHTCIQGQFESRTIKKRYSAILEGIPKDQKGSIKLPLRVDLHNRPQQMVCYEYGKHAESKYEVVSSKENRALIKLFPKTGRTHQLRVHCAHQDGLNCNILGDDLYGSQEETRLHLHAEWIQFEHPITRENVTFYSPIDFNL